MVVIVNTIPVATYRVMCVIFSNLIGFCGYQYGLHCKQVTNK